MSTENKSKKPAIFHSGKPQQDRAYEEMLKPVRDVLSGRDPAEVAVKCGGEGSADGTCVVLRTFAETVSVSLSDCVITPELESWHTLVLLHYLANADGVRPFGQWIGFEDMKDGLIRGTKFDRTSSAFFARFLKGKSSADMQKIKEKLGGTEVPGKGDLCFTIPFLPHFPLLFSFWEADEDFDASGKLMVDRCADHYLSIEDAVTVGDLIQSKFETLA